MDINSSVQVNNTVVIKIYSTSIVEDRKSLTSKTRKIKHSDNTKHGCEDSDILTHGALLL